MSRRSSFRVHIFSFLVGCILLSSSDAAIIVSVTEGSSATPYADPLIVPNGFGEDAVAFTDRLHQWNGYSTSNGQKQPTLAGMGLEGMDYVRTANDARAVSASSTAYTITFSEDARVFLFLDTRTAFPAWMTDYGFERVASTAPDGYYVVGYDEGQAVDGVGVGVGASIDTKAWVYTAKFAAGTYQFNGLSAGNNNYGIVATPVNTVVGGVARLEGSTERPKLLRGGLGAVTTAFVDRTHRWLISTANFSSLPGLMNADLIQMSNDVRSVSATTPLYEVTLLEDSIGYLLLDDRYLPTDAGWDWINAKGFVDTGVNIGIDETLDGISERNISVYMAYFTRGIHTFYGLQNGGLNQYGLAFHAVPEPSRGVLSLSALALLLFIRRRR